jgi:O-antigen/teichoic acid export membrane protein
MSMGSKIRGLAKDSVIYGVGSIAARAVGFLLLPYYSHLLSPAQYGVYALFMVMITLLQPFFVHGVDIAMLRFTRREELEGSPHLGQSLLQGMGVGGTLALALILLAPDVATLVVQGAGPRETMIVRITAGILLLDTLGYHCRTWLRIQRRPVAFGLVMMANVVVNISLNVLLVGVLGWGVVGAFWAFLFASLSTLLALLALVRRSLAGSWRWSSVREWLAFGLPNLPSQLFFVLVEFSDRKWIEHYLGLEQAGIYAAGYRISMLMSLVAQAFRFAWQPFFVQTSSDEDAREVFARVLTYYILAAGWLWLAASLLLPPLLKLPLPGVGPLIEQRYWAGFAVVPVVMLAHIFNGIYANLMAGVFIEKKTRVIPLVVGAAAVVNVVGNGLLVPRYGYMASAWLTVASYFLMAAGLYFYIAPRYPVPYEWRRIAVVAATLAGGWLLATSLAGPVGLILKGGVVLLLPLAWYKAVFTEGERGVLRRRLGRR